MGAGLELLAELFELRGASDSALDAAPEACQIRPTSYRANGAAPFSQRLITLIANR